MAGKLALALALLAACAEPPDVPDPGDGVDPGDPYADAILAFADGDSLRTCADVLPDCEAAPPTCGPSEALGPPDGDAAILEPGDSLRLGFRCSSIRERGGFGTPDLRLWATLAPGAHAVVEVSVDGSEFVVLDELREDDQELDLARVELEVVQHVQLAVPASSGGAVALDALEALRGPAQ